MFLTFDIFVTSGVVYAVPDTTQHFLPHEHYPAMYSALHPHATGSAAAGKQRVS